jgi:ABC-type transport system involved in cytochrome c biogenesis permease subunit
MIQKPQVPANSAAARPTKGLLEIFKSLAPSLTGAGLALLYFGIFMLPGRDDPNDFHFRQFGRLPAIDQGRCKPIDTVARMNLMVLTHRQQFYVAEGKRKMWGIIPLDGAYYPATKIFLDAATLPMPGNHPALAELFQGNNSAAMDYKVFRIENDQLLKALNLPMREGLRYSLVEVAPSYRMLFDEAQRIMGDEENDIVGVDPKNQTLVEAKTVELWQHLQLFLRMAGHSAPLVIPNAKGNDQWMSFSQYLNEAVHNGQFGHGIDGHDFQNYLKLLNHYGKGEKREFNDVLASHLADLEKRDPARMRAIDTEIFFNEFAPFYRCLEVYVVIALLAAFSWFTTTWGSTMRKAAFAAMVVAFAFHTSALCIRMYLQDRPPITNLYSAAVFIGWGSVLLALIVEAFYKNGFATVVGSALGFATLIIAHILSLDGDTMVMLQAVLDTNFWLATHVTSVTFGYVTVAVAGFMGISYIALGVFTNKLRGEGSADLTRMTYGVLCTGMFFSFVGTVLGGLWADYSWGRFWGWDPKENGALLIVMWVALILHARWGGLVKQRGIAVLSVLGLPIVIWSMFGTNFLGIGLHAYGGAKGSAMSIMVLFDFVFLGIAGLGLLPLEHWQSFRPAAKLETPPLPPAPATAIKPKPMGA